MTRRWTDGEKAAAGVLGVVAAGGFWWAFRRPSTAPSGALDAALQPIALPSNLAAVTGSRIEQLLASPISPQEQAELARGPRITVEKGVDPNSARVRCVTDYVRAHLRAAMAIRFDRPVPILGTYTLWEYINRNIDEIKLWSDYNRSMGIRVGTRVMDWPMQCPDRFFWSDPRANGAGINGTLPIMIHESRHGEAPQLPHNADEKCRICGDMQARSGTCPPGFSGHIRDSSLKYGGAGAAHYYTHLWLAEHSGDWLSPADRARAKNYADRMLQNYFCEK